MEILAVLQTIGICVGALALVVIAFMLFVTFTPTTLDDEEGDMVVLRRFLQGKTPDEIGEWLSTPVPPPPTIRRRTKKSRQTSRGDHEGQQQ